MLGLWRRAVLLVALLGALPGTAAAGPAATPPAEPAATTPQFRINQDGTAVTIQGRLWIAGGGISFLQRGVQLFVVCVEPGHAFLMPVPVYADEPFAFATNEFFEVQGNQLTLPTHEPPKPGPRHPRAERLVASGQIYPHLDHYHLTRHYERPTWQALYESRSEENTEFPPIRKRVAMSLIIRLLQEKVPGGKKFPRGKKKIDRLVDRAWRGFNDGLLGKQIFQTIDRDFEILKDGKLLLYKGRLFRAGKDVSFIYCSVHGVHVIGEGPGEFEYPFDLVGDADARLSDNMFFRVRKRKVLANKPNPKWLRLIRNDEIRPRDGHYRITLKYRNPELVALREAASEESPYSRKIRERAGSHLLELLKITFEPWTTKRLAGALGEINESIHLRYTDLQRLVAEEERANRADR